MATLHELFAGRNLTPLQQGTKSGLPLRIPEQMLNPTDSVVGHTAEWYELDGNRDMALVVSQESPAKVVGHQGAKKKSATMLRTFEKQVFILNNYRNLMTPDMQVRDDLGRQYIRRNINWFANRQRNLVQTAAQRMLFKFTLYFNEKGQMLTSSSGATTSIDVNIPSGQQTTLDILGDGAIIDASWATSSTNIPGHLENVRDQMLQHGGWQITEAYYGKNIAKYIGANDYAKNLIQNTESLATQMFRNGNRVPAGFMELNWHYAGDAFYNDADGNVQHLLGEDEIVFTPSPMDDTWWRHFHGSEIVPTGVLSAGQDVDGILNGNCMEVIGPFGYGKMIDDPMGVEHRSGLNFLPVITGLKAVCKAEVTPGG